MNDPRDGYFDLKRNVEVSPLHSLQDIVVLRDPDVTKLADHVNQDIRAWAAPYPNIMLNRVSSLSLTCSAMCVDWGPEAAGIAVQVAVLLFAIDDIVDGTVFHTKDEEAEALLRECSEIAANPDRHDTLASTLACISPEVVAAWREVTVAFRAYCAKLATFPHASHYYPFFARMFISAMEGMRDELHARREFIKTGAIPTFESYLSSGEKSIASPVVYAAVLVVVAPQFPLDSRITAALAEFAFVGGACLRLANDLRSYDRELEFEQRPNSVFILSRANDISTKEAERRVLALANHHLDVLAQAAASLPPELRGWGKAVHKFTALMRDWYLVAELHS